MPHGRENVTVALSGDGGDELLAGYITHRRDRYHRWAARVPRLAVRALQAGLDLLPESRRKLSMLYKAKQVLGGALGNACDAHAWWRMLCNQERLGRLLGNPKGLSPGVAFEPFRAAYAEAERLSPLDRMLYVDYKTYLVDDILVKVDSRAWPTACRSAARCWTIGWSSCAECRPRPKPARQSTQVHSPRDGQGPGPGGDSASRQGRVQRPGFELAGGQLANVVREELARPTWCAKGCSIRHRSPRGGGASVRAAGSRLSAVHTVAVDVMDGKDSPRASVNGPRKSMLWRVICLVFPYAAARTNPQKPRSRQDPRAGRAERNRSLAVQQDPIAISRKASLPSSRSRC